MLICDPRKCVSNVDRMALEHLRAAGVIVPNKAGRPRVEKRIPNKRVGWKRLNPTGWSKGACDQCGKASGTSAQNHPYGMALCPHCLAIHTASIAAGLKPTDEIKW